MAEPKEPGTWPNIPRPMGVEGPTEHDLLRQSVEKIVAEHKRHSGRENQTAFAKIEIVFDGPPGGQAPAFVEVECEGRSINFGMWRERDDGLWALEFLYPLKEGETL